MSARRNLRSLLAALALAGLAACVIPTIPVPPPDPSYVEFALDTTSGSATFHYDPYADYANHLVYIINLTQGEGVITTADAGGGVAESRPFPANDGDEVLIVFERDSEARAGICLEIHDGRSSHNYRCD